MSFMDELFPTKCMVSPNEVEETRQGYGQNTVILATKIIPIIFVANINPIWVRYMNCFPNVSCFL